MSSDVSVWIISDLTLEYLKVQVRATVNGNTPYNPTNDVVKWAFVAREAEPQASDWVLGTWETETVVTPNGSNNIYRAMCLVGPGGAKQLARGQYDVYVQVLDNPEKPVRGPYLLEVGE